MTVTITKVSPGGTVAGRWVPVVIDVECTAPMDYTYISVLQGSQKTLAWDGVWNDLFGRSVRSTLVAGKSYRYSILPQNGWQSAFDIDVRAGELSEYGWQNSQSILFDGVSDKIYCDKDDFDSIVDYNKAFSLLFWFKTTYAGATLLGAISTYRDTGNYEGFTVNYKGSTNEWQLYMRENLSSGMRKYGAFVAAHNDDAWHPLLVTKAAGSDESDVHIYSDTGEADSYNVTHNDLAGSVVSPRELTIGCLDGFCSPQQFWDGNITCMGLWDYELTAPERATVLANPRDLGAEGAAHFWPLGWGDTRHVFDRAGDCQGIRFGCSIVSDVP